MQKRYALVNNLEFKGKDTKMLVRREEFCFDTFFWPIKKPCLLLPAV